MLKSAEELLEEVEEVLGSAQFCSTVMNVYTNLNATLCVPSCIIQDSFSVFLSCTGQAAIGEKG